MKEGNKHVMGNEGREGRKQTENEEEEEDEDEDEAMEVCTLISIFFLHTLLFSLTYEKFKKNKRKFDRFSSILASHPEWYSFCYLPPST